MSAPPTSQLSIATTPACYRRRLLNVALLAVVGLGLSLTPAASQAGDLRLRDGEFSGNWCGSAATFKLIRRPGDELRFDGTVRIHSTNQVDRLVVRQLRDDSLHMLRYLPDTNTGGIQVIITHPPETLRVNGQNVANFTTKKTFGHGANRGGFLRMPLP